MILLVFQLALFEKACGRERAISEFFDLVGKDAIERRDVALIYNRIPKWFRTKRRIDDIFVRCSDSKHGPITLSGALKRSKTCVSNCFKTAILKTVNLVSRKI